MGYENLLGNEYSPEELSDAVDSLSDTFGQTFESDEMTDPKLLNMVYYDYFGGETEKITLGDFLSFLNDNVLNEKAFASFIDDEMRSQAENLKRFSDPDQLKKAIDSKEMAEVFGIDESQVKDLMLYYFTEKGGIDSGKMTVNEFASFVVDDLANDNKYSSQFDSEALKSVKQLKTFSDKDSITRPISASKMAKLLGFDKESAEMLYVLYFGSQSDYSPEKMTLVEFMEFMIDDVATSPMFKDSIDEASVMQMEVSLPLARMQTLAPPKSASELASTLGMGEAELKILMTYHDLTTGRLDGRKVSIDQMIDFILANKDQLGDMMDKGAVKQLKTLDSIMEAAAGNKKYNAKELAKIVGMDSDQMNSLFIVRLSKLGDTSNWKISISDMIIFLKKYVLNNAEYRNMLTDEMREDLNGAGDIVETVVSERPLDESETFVLLSPLSKDMTESAVGMLYLYYSSIKSGENIGKLSISQLFDYLSNTLTNDERFGELIDDKMREDIDGWAESLTQGVDMLKSDKYSRMIIYTYYPIESDETTEFTRSIVNTADNFEGNYYLIGNSAMNYEMMQTFKDEMRFITLLTAASIFLVVLLTMRSLAGPIILVLLVQCGVYLTVTLIGLQGYSIYYLALLIVECILMGATIDYGILFTNYYRENRLTKNREDSLKAAYAGSIHTIMTSGTIIVIVVGIVAYLYGDPTVEQICKTISMGAFCAILLILFVLPGLLATLDRLLISRKKAAK